MGNDLKNKKILVTGGSGSIGTYLIEMLDKSNELLNLDIKPPDEETENRATFKNIDIAENAKVEQIISEFKPNILFHLAAVFQRTKETVDFRNECFSSNVIGTHNVFESCVKNDIEQIIFPSSYLIYDEKQYLFDKHNLNHAPVALSEDSPINPRNITGVAKLYAERELDFFQEIGINTTSLRIFRVYGPKNQDIIDRWINSLLMNEEILVYGKEQVFDYVHAKDCALGCLKAAQAKKNGIFNIGSGIPTSVKEVLDILEDKFSQNFKLRENKFDNIEKYEKSYANIKKSKNMLNYKPEISISEGISLNIKAIKETL